MTKQTKMIAAQCMVQSPVAPHGDRDITIDAVFKLVANVAELLDPVVHKNLVKSFCHQFLQVVEITGKGFDVRLDLGDHWRLPFWQKGRALALGGDKSAP